MYDTSQIAKPEGLMLWNATAGLLLQILLVSKLFWWLIYQGCSIHSNDVAKIKAPIF